jgi:hypothetical protein
MDDELKLKKGEIKSMADNNIPEKKIGWDDSYQNITICGKNQPTELNQRVECGVDSTISYIHSADDQTTPHKFFVTWTSPEFEPNSNGEIEKTNKTAVFGRTYEKVAGAWVPQGIDGLAADALPADSTYVLASEDNKNIAFNTSTVLKCGKTVLAWATVPKGTDPHSGTSIKFMRPDWDN